MYYIGKGNIKMLERLKEFREKINKTQKEVAEEMNMQRSRYARYEQAVSEPDLETLLKLADYYKTTTDSLLGHQVDFVFDKSILTDEQLYLFNLIQTLSDEECRNVDSFIKGLKK